MADLTKIFISKSEKDTKKLAETLAQKAKRGDVFALFGTLGMGKSVFARAFIQKLTDAKEVPSPTFTLVQQYEASDFEIYHFDLYRLKSPDEVFESECTMELKNGGKATVNLEGESGSAFSGNRRNI